MITPIKIPVSITVYNEYSFLLVNVKQLDKLTSVDEAVIYIYQFMPILLFIFLIDS